MHRPRHKRSVPVLAIAITAAAAIAAVIGSCVFDTRTNFCEQFGVRCKEGQECAANQAVCIDIGGCGDGIIDKTKGEVCDDGNTVDGEPDPNDPKKIILDQCSHDCMSTQDCGNHIIDPGEECDLGSDNGSPVSTCDNKCHKVSRVCGNGMVDADTGEDCDPGPMDSIGCNGSGAGPLSCKAARCGDGYRNTAGREDCDSSGVDTMMCNGRICTLPLCGDNYLNMAAGEQCESSGKDTQTCNGTGAGAALACHFPACGDGYVNIAFTPSGGSAPEECDNPNGSDSQTCNGNNGGGNGPGACRKPACGDGYKNTALGEQCDTLGGSDSMTCNGSGAGAVKCQLSTCGDGYKNTTAGEQCETAKGSDSSICNGSGAGPLACHNSRCGDGYKNAAAGEGCDNGDADTATCNGSTAPMNLQAVRCQPVMCGDHYVNLMAEDCEPQNQTGSDTAICNGNGAGAVSCKTPTCGDGHVNNAFTPMGGRAPEQCDNLGGGDSATCNGNNNGGNGSGACRRPACGDGYVNSAFTPSGGNASEECDNFGGGDSATCNGNNNGSNGPGACRKPACGDGYLNTAAGEQCETSADCQPSKTCSSCKCI